ncbi:MAG: cobalt-precorrin 5A hydrolase [Clostridia bacterium]|nr:cobalt-precorrin 5A hydrolase [Clostridia bacterium]
MNIAVICYSDAGAALAGRVSEILGLPLSDVHSIGKFAVKYGFSAHEKITAEMGDLFSSHEALIFIGACGIAVRSIAPHLKSKTEDPAVLVLDDRGRYVIPILSGHIGGANALARSLAEKLGAEAIVTTATDGAGRFSCDAWASTHACAISSMETAKAVSAAILVSDVPVASEFALPEKLPAGLVPGEGGPLGVYIGVREEEPFTKTLCLIPRIVTLGIGCRRGISAEAIREAVSEALASARIDPRAVCRVASIDVKRDEAGLAEYTGDIGAELVFYTAEELAAVPGDFAESEFVKKTVGVGNVCERAAVLGAGIGKLLIGKTAHDGVTVAAAVRDWRVEF